MNHGNIENSGLRKWAHPKDLSGNMVGAPHDHGLEIPLSEYSEEQNMVYSGADHRQYIHSIPAPENLDQARKLEYLQKLKSSLNAGHRVPTNDPEDLHLPVEFVPTMSDQLGNSAARAFQGINAEFGSKSGNFPADLSFQSPPGDHAILQHVDSFSTEMKEPEMAAHQQLEEKDRIIDILSHKLEGTTKELLLSRALLMDKTAEAECKDREIIALSEQLIDMREKIEIMRGKEETYLKQIQAMREEREFPHIQNISNTQNKNALISLQEELERVFKRNSEHRKNFEVQDRSNQQESSTLTLPYLEKEASFGHGKSNADSIFSSFLKENAQGPIEPAQQSVKRDKKVITPQKGPRTPKQVYDRKESVNPLSPLRNSNQDLIRNDISVSSVDKSVASYQPHEISSKGRGAGPPKSPMRLAGLEQETTRALEGQLMTLMEEKAKVEETLGGSIALPGSRDHSSGKKGRNALPGKKEKEGELLLLDAKIHAIQTQLRSRMWGKV